MSSPTPSWFPDADATLPHAMGKTLIKRLHQKLFVPASLAGSIGAQAGALVAGRGIGFVRSVLLAWLLSQREFGVFQVAVAVVNLLVPLCSLGLTFGVLRHAPAHEVRGTLRVFSRRAAEMVLFVAVLTAVVLVSAPATTVDFVFAAGTQVSPTAPLAPSAAAHVPPGLVGVAAVCIVSLIVFHLVVDLMKGLRLFRAASLMEVLGVVSFSSLALVAPIVGFDSANAVLLAYGLGNVITCAFFLPRLRLYIRGQRVDRDATIKVPHVDTSLLRYSLWMAASQVAWHGLQQYVLWHLAIVAGYTQAAMFFTVRLFAQLVLLGGQTLSRAFSANVTRVWETRGPADALLRLDAGSKIGFLAILTLSVALALIKPWVLAAFPSDYAMGADCFEPLLLAYSWFAVLEFLLIRFHLEQKSIFTFWASFTGAVTNVGLALMMMGTPGAPATLDAATMLQRASWVCPAAAAVSVVTCLIVLTLSGKRPPLATLVLIAAFASLAVGPFTALAVLLLLAVCAFSPIGLFSSAERSVIAHWRTGR